jgi:hypothetical protein
MLPAAVPTPESWFGFRMGEDRKLASWERVTGYFEELPKTSPRIRVEHIGNTVDGKPMIAAFISDAATIRDLDRYRQIQARLADPRQTGEAQAAQLIASGKSIVMITCSIHSTEVASTFSAVEYAYRLLTEDTPKRNVILANTILILVPSLNPDGIDIVERWYAKTLGTPFEGTSPPELYHRYIGHDNNRDWYMFTQPETRNVVSRLHNVWHPQIVYDVHQQERYASRMFVPPWMDPIDPNVDPIISQWCNAVGAAMASDLTAAGLKGVAIGAMYDFWNPSRHYQAYHGGLRILSESASAKLATPTDVKPEEIQGNALGYKPRERSWNYLEPWMGGSWRVRDIIDYQLIAMESCLYQAAVRREDLLRSFYTVLSRAASRTAPFAFVVPARQADPEAARKLLETMTFGGIEVQRAAAPFKAGGSDFPPGSYVIRMQQPYSAWAKTLLERQDYPDLRLYPGGPPKRPYDTTAYSLPLLMGVDVLTAAAPFAANTNPATAFEFAGSRPARTTRKPRLAVYRSWIPIADEGWTRWLLDQFGYPYARITNRDLQSGKLKDRLDVIVFPDQQARTLESGYLAGEMPPEYTGGVGEKGVAAMKEFAQAGGTIVFLNESAEYGVARLQLPVKISTKGLREQDYYAPGSILNGIVDERQRLGEGLPGRIAFWSEHSPAFEVDPGRDRIVVRYPDDNILASGWLLGEKYLKGKAALVEVPVGEGRVLLFGMRPQYRGQSYQTFRLFFNALGYFE